MAIFDCNNTNLKKGSKGENVKTLQTHLKTLGYYSAAIDGDFGSVTEKAVKAFQKTAGGLKQDGWFGPASCKKFNVMMESKGYAKDVNIKLFDCPNITLKRGHKGENVKLLQTMLKTLGYYTREIDGDFGMYTEQAVKAFQTKTNHTPDGVFGPKTCPDLNKQYSKKVQQGMTNKYRNPPQISNVKPILTLLPEFVVLPEEVIEMEEDSESSDSDSDSSDSSSSDEEKKKKQKTATTTKVRSKGFINTTANFDCKKINLSQGSKGDNVTKLQTVLKTKGYYTRAIDGDFGKYTKEAVKKLQAAQGNSQDGIFGPKTCASLQKLNPNDPKSKPHTITAIPSVSTSDDMEGLSHEITVKMLYKDEYIKWMQKLQKTQFKILHGDDEVYNHEGYINEIKIAQENDVLTIELSIVGYTVFLDQNVTYQKTAKRSELLKELIEMAGLKPDIDLTGMDDSEYTIKVVKTKTGGGSDGGSGLTEMSGNDCTDTWSLSAHSFDINTCKGNTKIGNSSANYAQDTKNMSAKEAIKDVQRRFKYSGYPNNRTCPQRMWNKSGTIRGNCADAARLIKCLGEVHGLKVGIHHWSNSYKGHYFNVIEINGKTYRFDLCFRGGISNNYGNEVCNTLTQRGGPWA